MAREYLIRQHPKTKEWFVVGYTGTINGSAKYIPISQGYQTKREAITYLKYVPQMEIAAKTCPL